MPDEEIFAASKWKSNADLIADCAELGYLRKEWTTLDPCWGLGNFWTKWRPEVLVGHDIDPSLSPTGESVDACNMPYEDRSFDVVVMDGPYKFNGKSIGTGPATSDKSYGVHVPASPNERMDLLIDMLVEGERVMDKILMFKCQPQVVSGKKFWQDHIIWREAESIGLRLIDQFYFLGYRKQPTHNIDGSVRRQVHARSNYSTLMVFGRT